MDPYDLLPALVTSFAGTLRREVEVAVGDAIARELPRAIRAATRAEYLTREEAAGYLCVSLRTLDYLRTSGRIAWSKRRGRVVVATTDLDAYLDAGRVPAKRTGAA